MTHAKADSSPSLSTLADKLWMVFGTFKPKILYGDNFCFEEICLQEKLFTLIGPLHLMTLYLYMERIMALQQIIDKKNTFLFI